MNDRFPGVKPFSFEEKNIFFGRDKDIENLTELISLKQLVVMHSKSGLGKSSLINAGLIPNFNNDFKIIPVRFRSYYATTSVTFRSNFLYKFENRNNTFLNKLIISDSGLWSGFKQQQIQTNNSNFLIIIDQFEELFTYPEEVIKQFGIQVADLLYSIIPQNYRNALEAKLKNNHNFLTTNESEILFSKLNIKMLLALRSDKLSLLNRLKNYLPDLLQNMYELGSLSWEQAEDAITIPASYSKKNMQFVSKPFYISDSLLTKTLNFLTQNKAKDIETFQLQILCKYIENIVVRKELQTVECTDIDDFESIYKNYYENLLEEIKNPEERKNARVFIEEGLIFESEERRISLYEGQILRNFKVTKPLLDKLVDTHLIRVEPHSSGGNYYEISHDTLIAPILQAKANRHLRERELLALKKQEEAIERQRKKTALYKNIAGVIVLPLVILTVLTFYFFDRSLTLRNNLALTEMRVKSIENEKNDLSKSFTQLKKSQQEVQKQKEQLDIQVKYLAKSLNNAQKNEVVELIKNTTEEKFKTHDYAGAVSSMQSLQNLYDKIDADRTAQAVVYGQYAWYLLFVKDYSTAAFKANVGLSFDKSQVWINKNLAHALLLDGKYESAKKIYLKYEDEIYTLSTRRHKMKDVYLRDFEKLEAAGITSEYFKKMKELLTSVN